jgi:O-antigen/teichoic acid export membrane protein
MRGQMAVPVKLIAQLIATPIDRERIRSSAVSRSFATSLLIQALNVVTGILLARSLGPSGRGALAAVLLWPMILASVGSLGLAESATYLSARRTERAGGLLGTALVLALAQSALLVGIGLLIEPLVLRHLGPQVHLGWLFLAYIPLNLVTLSVMGVLNGLGRFGAFNLVRIVVIVSTAVGLVSIAAGAALTIRAAVLVYLGANVLTMSVAVFLAWRTVSNVRPSRDLVRPMLAFGLKSHLGNVSSLANERSDQLLISVVLAPRLLGLYVVAVTLTSLTNLVGSSVDMVAVSRIAAEGDQARKAELARKYFSLTVVGSALISLPLLAVTPMLVTTLFGENFGGAVNAARILLVAAIVLSTNRALAAILKGVGQPLDAGLGEVIALVVTAALLPLMLWRFGIVGAAIASLLAYCTSLLWNVGRCSRRLQLGRSSLFMWSIPRDTERGLAVTAAPAGRRES